MHTALLLASLLLIVLGSYLALRILRRLGGWPRRRGVQLLVLAAPVVSLGLGLGALLHFTGRACFLGAPRWDTALATMLPLAMGLLAVGGLGLGVARLILLGRVISRSGEPAGPELRAIVDRLAKRLGVPGARVLVCADDRPLALVCGLRRPTVLLSRWMVERLDRGELEAALAHELAHVARRDHLVVWLATVLRDAFCYLPASWVAYRQLQHEKELACDDLAVRATDRPLALASALAKVWQQRLGAPAFGAAQSLARAGEPIEGRIERLLATASPPAGTGQPRSRAVAVGAGAAALAGLLTVEVAALAFMLARMGCGPASSLGLPF